MYLSFGNISSPREIRGPDSWVPFCPWESRSSKQQPRRRRKSGWIRRGCDGVHQAMHFQLASFQSSQISGYPYHCLEPRHGSKWITRPYWRKKNRFNLQGVSVGVFCGRHSFIHSCSLGGKGDDWSSKGEGQGDSNRFPLADHSGMGFYMILDVRSGSRPECQRWRIFRSVWLFCALDPRGFLTVFLWQRGNGHPL